MPRKFERPKNLPEDVPIYHITPRDADADLLLKITAMKTNKTAVIPVFKEDMVEYLPNYFGRIFDVDRNYEFKKNMNRQQQNDFYEMKIPNLVDPKNLALVFEEFILGSPDKVKKSKIHHMLTTYYKVENLRDFYWIASYLHYHVFLEPLSKRLSSEDPTFCIDIAFACGYRKEFAASNNSFYKKEACQTYIVKNLLHPNLKLSIERFKELNQMNLGLQLCIQVGEHFVPVAFDNYNCMQAVKEGRNIYLKRKYDDFNSHSKQKLLKHSIAKDEGCERLKHIFDNSFRP